MNPYELIRTEPREGFQIRFYAAPEIDRPEDHFDDPEIVSKIYNGDFAWFVAKVTASLAGVELGADYLGGCCYDSPEDFTLLSDYYPDMINAAIANAKDTLAILKSV